jgi:hypothetical protein
MIDVFNGFSVFYVRFMNRTDGYDLDMSGYQFVFVGPDRNPVYAMKKSYNQFPSILNQQYNDIILSTNKW